MTTQTLRANWHIVKGKLKERYAILTASDLNYEEGKEEELIGRIQKRTGAKRDEIEPYLDDDRTFRRSDSQHPSPITSRP